METLQIVRALTRPGNGWRHHPAVRMWRGYEEALGAYGIAICREWQRRGYADSCEVKITEDLSAAGGARSTASAPWPSWRCSRAAR